MKKEPMTFDPEELLWPSVDARTDKYSLLMMKGMFHFRHIRSILNLKSSTLTALKNKCAKNKVDMYQEYGVKKVAGSQYIIRMSRFSRYYTEHYLGKKSSGTPYKVQVVPQDAQNVNSIFRLKGIYKFNDIRSLPPLSQFAERILTKIQPVKSEIENLCGIWLDPTVNEYVVNMEVFKRWFLEHMWNTHE